MPVKCKKESNERNCLCLHKECSRHGICCECLKYHLSQSQLPACCFPKETADTDERSIERFAEINKKAD